MVLKHISTFIVAISATAFLFFSCANRKVTRLDPTTQNTDLSGRWNAVDSRLTSDTMIYQVLGGGWINDYVIAKGKKPIVIVGLVTNQSYEHIEEEMFIKDLERAFINSGKVRLVQAGIQRAALRAERNDQNTSGNTSPATIKKIGAELGADFILQGTINSNIDAYKNKKVITYQINLELTNIETNEVVWIGDKKIAKYIQN